MRVGEGKGYELYHAAPTDQSCTLLSLSTD